MRSWDAWLSSLAACLLACPALAEAASRTTDARKLYNQGLYELAIRAANEARQAGDAVDEASLIFARAHLERFRQTRDAHNLSEAQAALRAVDADAACRRRRRPSSRWPWASGCSWPTSSARPPSCSTRPRPTSTTWGRWRATACSTGGRRRSIGRRRKIPRTARRSTSASSTGWKTSFACSRARPRPATGLPPRRDPWATPNAPGTPRWRGTCARGSPPIAAPRCAPTSIGWWPRPSSPSVRAR